MNKIEYMAMSLPYGLKIHFTGEVTGRNYITILSEGNFRNTSTEKEYFPILRPISDLIQEIDFKGEMFIPMIKMVNPKNTEWDKMEAVEYNPFNFMEGHHKYYKINHETLGEVISINPKNILVLPFHLVQMLVEWNFDICGLIEKGEAVDYHTLSDFVF